METKGKDQNKNKVIDRVVNHYSNQRRLVINVPEWGDGEKPLEIHILPMTMLEVNMVRKMGGKNSSNIEQVINMIIVKAKDKDGNRIFSVNDKDMLMQKADYSVLGRIAENIEKHFFADMETSKGNLEETLSASNN